MYFAKKQLIEKFNRMYKNFVYREYTFTNDVTYRMCNEYNTALCKLTLTQLKKLNRRNYRKVVAIHSD